MYFGSLKTHVSEYLLQFAVDLKCNELLNSYQSDSQFDLT